MRGKETAALLDAGTYRITPAYAGKSRSRKRVLISAVGSPPPMRGKERRRLREKVRCRITPASAGKSSSVLVVSIESEDHPRLCGEKPASSSLVRFQPGSPPPMRGKGCISIPDVQLDWITPAYAGKRQSCRS